MKSKFNCLYAVYHFQLLIPIAKVFLLLPMSCNYLKYRILQQQVRFLDMWEPAVLAIKREGYSIKCNGQRGGVITEKFQEATAVSPYSLA